MSDDRPRYTLAVCGGGPAGTGPFVAAARDGLLDELLDRGVVLIDRGRPGPGKLGDYRVAANSLGGAFLEGVDGIGSGPLAGLADCPEARRLRAYDRAHPPLELVAPFLARVGDAVADLLRHHPRCRVVSPATVDEVRYRVGGGVAVRATPGGGGPALTLTADRALLAMGGRPDRDPTGFGPDLAGPLRRAADRTVHADEILDRTRPVPAAILRAVRETGRVTVVGSSHSAWSVAWLLQRGEFDDGLDGGPADPGAEVRLLGRHPVRLYYTSPAEASADGYGFTAEDICPLSGRVNRYGGLRGPARDLARATLGLVDAPSPVRLLDLAGMAPAEIAAELDRAAAVVLATGHRAHLPRLRRPDGTDIEPGHAAGGTTVDGLGRLVAADGAVHPALIVYGLGAGLRPTPQIGGEPSFHRRATGVWLYQNHLGSVVVRDLLGAARPGADLPGPDRPAVAGSLP
nr:hypothetical protein [Micromonospora sp. DSM 115978]